MSNPNIPNEDFRESIGVVQVPQNPALVSDSLAAPTKGAKANVSKRAVSFTDADPKRIITGETIIATHVYQPPLIDGLKTVGNITKTLIDGIFNFQQTNYRSWFGLRPQLIIRNSLEYVELGTSRIDDTALALGYKRLASRAANRVYHYIEAVKLLVSAMYNMAVISRFEGDTLLKSFASDLRSSRLNTILANAARYPVPKGIYDKIKSTCIYLAGVTSDGIPIISIPRIDVSIFGNKGVHCNTPSNFVSLSGRTYKNPTAHVSDGQLHFLDPNDTVGSIDGESEDLAFMDLMANIETTIYHFAGGAKRLQAYVDGTDANAVQDVVKYKYDFRGPVAHNTANVNVCSDSNFNAMAELNGHGPVILNEKVSEYTMNAEFTQLIMNQAFEIMRYIDENFSDFAIINNDWYKLVVEDLGLCERSGIRLSTMIADARGMKYGDINEFIEATKTSRHAGIACHSIVKYMPVVGNPYQSSAPATGDSGELVMRSEYISGNFERFDFSGEDPVYTLRNAKRVPRFNPTLFFVKDGNENEVFCGNTGPNFKSSDIKSVQSNTANDTKVRKALLANGQRALFDYTRVVQNDPSLSKMRFSGITPEDAKAIVDKDNAVTVFYEDKTQLFIDTLPAIDTTDMYANGFSILFFTGSQFPSMTARVLMDPKYLTTKDEQFKVPIRGVANVTGGQLPTGLAPLSPAVFADGYTADVGAKALSQSTPEQVKREFCYEAFIGAGILYTPFETSALSATGTFATCDSVDTDVKATFYNTAVLGAEAGRGVITPLSSASSESGGIPSFKMAMCPLTIHAPKYSNGTWLTNNHKWLRNSNLNVMDLLKGSAAGSTDSHVVYKYVGSGSGRVRLNARSSPLSGYRRNLKGMMPDGVTWDTPNPRVVLGQLHNGADYTSQDDNSIDPVVDAIIPGELSSVSENDVMLRRITTAVPVVDTQAIRYSDYPFSAYTGDHFVDIDDFILTMNADTEVTAVGTKDEEYLLDIIGKEIGDNYVAPVTGKYVMTANNYVADVVVKFAKRDYPTRDGMTNKRSGELKTVGFKADKRAGNDDHRRDNKHADRDKSTRRRKRGRKPKAEVMSNDNHMQDEMKEVLGKEQQVSVSQAESIKGSQASGVASYPTTAVM